MNDRRAPSAPATYMGELPPGYVNAFMVGYVAFGMSAKPQDNACADVSQGRAYYRDEVVDHLTAMEAA